ncbi:MAG TPA: hypothetical protein VFQ09_00065 [Rubrobacter sp.]|nr:hypothetical protein [Rubrobacter sp.]
MTGEPGSLPDAKFLRTRSARITAITIRTQKSANTPPDCHNAVGRAKADFGAELEDSGRRLSLEINQKLKGPVPS